MSDLHDLQLWLAAHNGKEVRATVRKIHARQDSGDLFGVELRITKGNELIRSEIFHDVRSLHTRSMQLFDQLAAKGWSTTTDDEARKD